MWFIALITSAFLAAAFLIITLALMEAGTKAKSRWLVLTICSIAVMTVLIVFKPKANMEQVQHIPDPPQVSENVAEQRSPAAAASVPAAAGTLSGEQKTQGLTAGDIPHYGGGAADPVLAEILDYKRQLENIKKGIAPVETSLPPEQEQTQIGADATAAGVAAPSQPVEAPAPDGADSPTAGQSGGRENERQAQNQQVIKGRVLASNLNVRDQGSPEGQVIGSLNTGDLVEVVDQSGTSEWVNVRLNSGQKGWVMKKYISISEEESR